MDKVLVLLRGVPGCGKTTVANLLLDDSIQGEMYAADDYFARPKGGYEFDRDKLGEAHWQCQENVRDAMSEEVSPIIVHNTSTMEKELAPYQELADSFGYKVLYLVVENRHGGVNQHDVPEETLVRMEQRLRDSIKLR